MNELFSQCNVWCNEKSNDELRNLYFFYDHTVVENRFACF